MSEAVAPSRAMRSRANRRESSVARGIELDSPSLKSTDLAGLYHVERPRETWCRNFARNLVSRDRLLPSLFISPRLRTGSAGASDQGPNQDEDRVGCGCQSEVQRLPRVQRGGTGRDHSQRQARRRAPQRRGRGRDRTSADGLLATASCHPGSIPGASRRARTSTRAVVDRGRATRNEPQLAAHQEKQNYLTAQRPRDSGTAWQRVYAEEPAQVLHRETRAAAGRWAGRSARTRGA